MSHRVLRATPPACRYYQLSVLLENTVYPTLPLARAKEDSAATLWVTSAILAQSGGPKGLAEVSTVQEDNAWWDCCCCCLLATDGRELSTQDNDIPSYSAPCPHKQTTLSPLNTHNGPVAPQAPQNRNACLPASSPHSFPSSAFSAALLSSSLPTPSRQN